MVNKKVISTVLLRSYRELIGELQMDTEYDSIVHPIIIKGAEDTLYSDKVKNRVI